VRLRVLRVSVDDPDGLIAALTTPDQADGVDPTDPAEPPR